jgi:nuclear GTP-binding protein
MMYREKPDFQKMKKQAIKPARIPPNRKWFGNIRTIEQKNLEKFRIELAEATRDPFKVLIAAKKLPISLLKNPLNEKRANILDIQDYSDVFGSKSTRKRPKLRNYTY